MKILSLSFLILAIISATYLTVHGFTGNMTSWVGGVGWALVLINQMPELINKIINRSDK